MDQETFNLSIRKFLKMVGVNSQREIELAVGKALETGTLKVGDEILFSPSNKRVRVASIEAWAAAKAPLSASAGRSVGITLDDQIFVQRGEVVSHADQPPVDVELRFAPAVASRVLEATWHPSQRVERETDGSLRWTATVAGTIEIRLWILSWGADVEVIGPEELRRDVAATLERASQRYRA